MSDSSDPMDCSLPGSSVHGIFHARVLEWGAIAFSVQSLWSRTKEEAAQKRRQIDGIANSVDMTLSKLRETVEDRGTQHAAVHGVAKSRTLTE